MRRAGKDSSPLNLRHELCDASECDLLGLKVDPSPHRVDDGLGLLEDLLLHERGVLALHDLLDLELQGEDLPENLRKLNKLFFELNISLSFSHLLTFPSWSLSSLWMPRMPFLTAATSSSSR